MSNEPSLSVPTAVPDMRLRRRMAMKGALLTLRRAHFMGLRPAVDGVYRRHDGRDNGSGKMGLAT